MSDAHMLAMPARRFWSMERQISRIMSERDLRTINVNRATITAEAMEAVVEQLTLEIGETVEIERQAIVKPQADFAERMKRLSGIANAGR